MSLSRYLASSGVSFGEAAEAGAERPNRATSTNEKRGMGNSVSGTKCEPIPRERFI